MLNKLGRLTRPGRTAPGLDEPAQPPDRPALFADMVVYAEDCVVSGRVRLPTDRVSDLLNDAEIFDLVDVAVEDLGGKRTFDVHELQLRRDEILLVHAGNPRGDPGRRHRTRQHPIAAKAGPYVVRGYLHALPGSDPIASLRRRKPMVALTDAVIEYTAQGEPQVRRASVVILNREGTDWVVEGHDAEVDMPAMPVNRAGKLLKDFTGDVLDLDAHWNR